MAHPLPYHPGVPVNYGGLGPDDSAYQTAKAVILPIPFERTTSYGAGTRNGPREILLASAQVELWDEETSTQVYQVGIHTLPDMELPHPDTATAFGEIRNTVGALLDAGKFIVALGGEHSITPPIVEAAVARTPGLTVLQIDAHADLRDAYMGNRLSHACAMRRVTEFARCTQVAIRNMSAEEAVALPALPTRIFFDFDMRQTPDWMDQVVESLGQDVYLTIDCDGLDPAIMPAVGTPEPGGLSWRETLTLLRKVALRRNIVACDIVELAPIPGMLAPNFLCARLVYKILTYRFLGR
jgi:agmatinase